MYSTICAMFCDCLVEGAMLLLLGVVDVDLRFRFQASGRLAVGPSRSCCWTQKKRAGVFECSRKMSGSSKIYTVNELKQRRCLNATSDK
jgi:hypothetical protein